MRSKATGEKTMNDINHHGVAREEKGKWRFLAWQSCKNPDSAAKNINVLKKYGGARCPQRALSGSLHVSVLGTSRSTSKRMSPRQRLDPSHLGILLACRADMNDLAVAEILQALRHSRRIIGPNKL